MTFESFWYARSSGLAISLSFPSAICILSRSPYPFDTNVTDWRIQHIIEGLPDCSIEVLRPGRMEIAEIKFQPGIFRGEGFVRGIPCFLELGKRNRSIETLFYPCGLGFNICCQKVILSIISANNECMSPEMVIFREVRKPGNICHIPKQHNWFLPG